MFVLHDWDTELFPGQPLPPLRGRGLVHDRRRVCDPPPHVTLQTAQAPQDDHPPSTIKQKYTEINKHIRENVSIMIHAL